MKSKVFKIVLPAFAFMLAVALSFAAGVVDVAPTGYFDDPFIAGIQSEPTDCEIQQGNPCLDTSGQYQLYDTPELKSGEELRKP